VSAALAPWPPSTAAARAKSCNRTRKTAETFAVDLRYGTPHTPKVEIVDGHYDSLRGVDVDHMGDQREDRRRDRPRRSARPAATPRQVHNDLPRHHSAHCARRLTDPPDPLADIALHLCVARILARPKPQKILSFLASFCQNTNLWRIIVLLIQFLLLCLFACTEATVGGHLAQFISGALHQGLEWQICVATARAVHSGQGRATDESCPQG
jgi:hypothetical protein